MPVLKNIKLCCDIIIAYISKKDSGKITSVSDRRKTPVLLDAKQVFFYGLGTSPSGEFLFLYQKGMIGIAYHCRLDSQVGFFTNVTIDSVMLPSIE